MTRMRLLRPHKLQHIITTSYGSNSRVLFCVCHLPPFWGERSHSEVTFSCCTFESSVKSTPFFLNLLIDLLTRLLFSLAQIFVDLKETIAKVDADADLKKWSLTHGVDMPPNFPVFQVGNKQNRAFFFNPCLDYEPLPPPPPLSFPGIQSRDVRTG